MEKTQQIDTSGEKESDSDFASKVAVSRDLQDGLKIDNASVELTRELRPKSWYQISRVKNKSILVSSSNYDGEISEEDIRNSVEAPYAGYRVSGSGIRRYGRTDVIDDRTLENFDSQRKVAVVKEDENHVAVCEVTHEVKITFTDTFGNERTLSKSFNKRQNAVSFMEKVESYNNSMYCWYDDGFTIGIKGKYRNFVFKQFAESTGDEEGGAVFWGTFASVMYGTMTGDFLAAGFAFFFFVLFYIGILMVKGYKKYREEDGFLRLSDFDTTDKSSFRIDNPDDYKSYDSQKVVTVELRDSGEKVELLTDDVDAEWSYELDDGVLPSDVVDFFTVQGFDTEDGDSMILTAIKARTYDGDASAELYSNDEEWVLTSRDDV